MIRCHVEPRHTGARNNHVPDDQFAVFDRGRKTRSSLPIAASHQVFLWKVGRVPSNSHQLTYDFVKQEADTAT